RYAGGCFQGRRHLLFLQRRHRRRPLQGHRRRAEAGLRGGAVAGGRRYGDRHRRGRQRYRAGRDLDRRRGQAAAHGPSDLFQRAGRLPPCRGAVGLASRSGDSARQLHLGRGRHGDPHRLRQPRREAAASQLIKGVRIMKRAMLGLVGLLSIALQLDSAHAWSHAGRYGTASGGGGSWQAHGWAGGSASGGGGSWHATGAYGGKASGGGGSWNAKGAYGGTASGGGGSWHATGAYGGTG